MWMQKGQCKNSGQEISAIHCKAKLTITQTIYLNHFHGGTSFILQQIIIDFNNDALMHNAIK